MTSKLGFSPQAVSALKKIHAHFESAQAEFRKLNPVEQQAVFEYHIEGSSLTHCLRLGEQAASELIADAGQN